MRHFTSLRVGVIVAGLAAIAGIGMAARQSRRIDEHAQQMTDASRAVAASVARVEASATRLTELLGDVMQLETRQLQQLLQLIPGQESKDFG